MKRLVSSFLFIGVGFLAMIGVPIRAASFAVEDEDTFILEKFLEHTRNELSSLTAEHFAQIKVPEKLCWTELPKLNMGLTAYELTGGVDYLKSFVTAFENLRATAKPGPGGFIGWYGEAEASLKNPAKPEAVVSEIQTDFRAVAVIARFLELTTSQEEFSALHKPYRELAEGLVRKWDGSYLDLGQRGGTYQWNAEYKPAMANLSLPYEKLSLMVEGLLGLYRVTGSDEAMQKAVKLGIWYKSGLELAEERYSWNRWNPAGNWEVNPENPLKWKSWVGKEPKPEWYASSVRIATLLYQHGVVFSETDLQRFVQTQTKICWNGDLETPQFFQVDGKAAKDNARFIAPTLAPFDSGIADLLYRGEGQILQAEKSSNPWTGGVLAGDWLLGKYVLLANTKSGPPAYREAGKGFLAKDENAAFAKALEFEVKPPGAQTPPVPPQAGTDNTRKGQE